MNMSDISPREARLLKTSKALLIELCNLANTGRGIPVQILDEAIDLGEAVRAYNQQQPTPVNLDQYFDRPGR